MTRILILALGLSAWLLVACDQAAEETLPVDDQAVDLPIGDIDDLKTDGNWGAATTCKAIPDLATWAQPEIVISLDGLTLHLYDKATGQERVWPIGPGKIDKGLSLTPTSMGKPGNLFYARLDQPEVVDAQKAPGPWAWNYRCKFWWKDDATGKYSPVFAGLPFIRLEGPSVAAYGIHGPIDSFTLPNGGKLKRGFVSHGCIRMEAADLLELYSLCRGKKVPVRLQKSVERRTDGLAVDLPQRWLLSECLTDADCNYTGGVCHHNPYTALGFCTAACTKYCSYDKFGYPTSFCVADPDDDGKGLCTLKSEASSNSCRRFAGMLNNPGEPRFSDPGTKADACLPGSEGWVGQPCFSQVDCLLSGGFCDQSQADESTPGVCAVGCTKYCNDKAGYASTFCVTGAGGQGQCAAKCVLNDDCATGYACTPGVPRFNQPSATASVCQ
jgi:hypothetical protein